MLRLFVINNNIFNDDGLFEKFFATADGERRAKISALALREAKNRSLAAGVILPLALKECGYCGIVKQGRGKYGKPCLVEPDGLFFNLSHSGDYTAVAVSDGEVGCDIQQIKPADLRVARRFYSEEEREAVESAGEGAEELFYRIWTAKESYLKALGVGLNRLLASFSVRFSGESAEIDDPQSAEKWRVYEYCGLHGYRIAVCSRQSVSLPEAEELFVKL